MSINFEDDSLCVKAYDVETKQVIGTYDNFKKAGKELGVTPITVARRCKSKTRLFVTRLNKEIALRLTRKDLVTA
jgi:hypothetical protein